MKNFFKGNYKLLIGMAIGIIGTSALTASAAVIISSSDVSYKLKGSSKAITVKEALDKLYDDTANSIRECKTSPFKLGDYIAMTPDLVEATITTNETGYYNDQVIHPSEVNEWRVLHINPNCTVDLISEYTSRDYVNFSGLTGYTKYVQTLNNISKKFEKTGYTVGARGFGFNNQTEYISDTSKLTNPSVTPWQNGTIAGNNDEKLGGGDSYYYQDMGYLGEAGIGLITKTAVDNYSGYYWIASREYGNHASGNEVNWSVGINVIYPTGQVMYSSLYYAQYGSFNNNNSGNAVRPIVTLGSDVKIGSGSGTKANMYTLTK